MLKTIVLLSNMKINTQYELIKENFRNFKIRENALYITDSEELLGELKECPVLFVNNEDRFIDNVKFVTDSLSDCDDDYFNMVYSRQKGLPIEIMQTERTIIREICVNDLEDLYRMYDDELICKFLEPLYEYEEEKLFTEKYIENMYGLYGYGLWVVFDKKTGELMGRVGIEIRTIDGEDKNEIGYSIKREYRNKGYAFETCQAVLKYAQDVLEIEEMFCVTHKNNLISRHVSEKLGFEFYGESQVNNEKFIIFLKKLKKFEKST